jgi:hypothetical protein
MLSGVFDDLLRFGHMTEIKRSAKTIKSKSALQGGKCYLYTAYG